MPKVTGPCFSLSASKSLKKVLTYQKRPSGHAVYPYKKPGGRAPFTPSYLQRNQRGIIGLLTAHWQSFSQATRDQWDVDAKAVGYQGTGYHFWIREAQKNLPFYHGLQLYLSFNIGSGCVAPDLSGRGNNGILEPACPANSPVWVPGQNEKFGSALLFDGVNDYVDCGDPADGNLDFGTGDFSVEVWLKNSQTLAAAGNTYGIANKFQGALLPGWTLALRGGAFNGCLFRVGGVGGSQNLTPSINQNAKLSDGNWHNIVVTRALGTGKMFIDSDEVRAGNMSKTVTNSINQGIGIFTFVAIHFGGSLDEFRIYNRALSPEEILRHYRLFRR